MKKTAARSQITSGSPRLKKTAACSRSRRRFRGGQTGRRTCHGASTYDAAVVGPPRHAPQLPRQGRLYTASASPEWPFSSGRSWRPTSARPRCGGATTEPLPGRRQPRSRSAGAAAAARHASAASLSSVLSRHPSLPEFHGGSRRPQHRRQEQVVEAVHERPQPLQQACTSQAPHRRGGAGELGWPD